MPVTSAGPSLADLLPIIIPVLLLELVLIVVALRDLARPERRVRYLSKTMWMVLVILTNWVGCLLYFLVGRDES